MPKFTLGSDGKWRNQYGQLDEPSVRGITPGHPPAGRSSSLTAAQEWGLRLAIGDNACRTMKDVESMGLTFDTNKGVSLKPEKVKIAETFADARSAINSMVDKKYIKDKGLTLVDGPKGFELKPKEAVNPHLERDYGDGDSEPDSEDSNVEPAVTMQQIINKAKAQAEQKAADRQAARNI